MDDQFKIKYTGTGFPELWAKLSSKEFWKKTIWLYVRLVFSRMLGH